MTFVNSVGCKTTAKTMDDTCKVNPAGKEVCNKPAIVECKGLKQFEPKIPPKKIPLKRKTNPNLIKARCDMTFQTALANAGSDNVTDNSDIVIVVCGAESCGSQKSAPADHTHEFESDDGICLSAEQMGISSSSVSS